MEKIDIAKKYKVTLDEVNIRLEKPCKQCAEKNCNMQKEKIQNYCAKCRDDVCSILEANNKKELWR